MKVEIEISEDNIAQIVEELIARQFMENRGTEYREARNGVRDGVDKAIKKLYLLRKR